MNSKEYQKECLRTEDVAEFTNNLSPTAIRLLHVALGVSTEANEFADIIKKSMFYTRPFDKEHMMKELGDILWYVAVACDVLDTSLEELYNMNIRKLKARYPDKFTTERANNRKQGDI